MLYSEFFSLLNLVDSPVFATLSSGLELPTLLQFCPPLALIASLLQIRVNNFVSILITVSSQLP